MKEIFSAVAVVAGNGASGYEEDVEAVDLQRGGLGQVCDTLPDYPFSMGGATGALFEGVLKVIFQRQTCNTISLLGPKSWAKQIC